MDSHAEFWIENAIKRWYRDQSTEIVLKKSTSPMGVNEQGYLSEMWRVSCDVMLASGVMTTKRFVVKKETGGKFAETFIKKYGVFRREIRVYNGVLRKMENLMRKQGDTKGLLWSRMCGFTEYDTLILEDLSAKGYETFNRKSALDVEHSLFFIVNLARFHGMGLILLNHGAVHKNDFGPPPLYLDEMLTSFGLNPLGGLSQSMKDSWGPEWANVAKKIDEIKDKGRQLLHDLLNSTKSTMNVVNHADYRLGNFLVKRDYLGRPLKCKMIDFQFTNYSSFATDLHFFMFMSIEPEVRRKNYNLMIEEYYSTLKETLKFYDYPESLTPSLTEVKEEMRRCSLVGFLLVVPSACELLTKKDRLDPDVAISMSDDTKKVFGTQFLNSEKFKEGFAQDISNFIKNGYFY